MGRLQRVDRRSVRRLHILVHAGILLDHYIVQLANTNRLVQIPDLRCGKYADTYADEYPDKHSEQHRDSDLHADANKHGDGYCDGDIHADGDGDKYLYPNAHGYRDIDRKSTRLNSSHVSESR